MYFPLLLFLFGFAAIETWAADWPMLRGSADHSGYVRAEVPRSVGLQWVVEFEGERLGTAVEPVVSNGKLYTATHAGNLYALDALSGEAEWRFHSEGPFLNSPAVAKDQVIAAGTDGWLYALDSAEGKLAWRAFAGAGGCSGSPLVADGKVFIGTRSGEFLGVDLITGKEQWRQNVRVPIRQTASMSDGRVFVTAEDMRVRAINADEGKTVWISEPLQGQTARDYYPVVVKTGGRTFVLIRTNPLLNMGQRIGRDRTVLCRNAGVDDSSWQKLDTWIKSGQRGTPDLWTKEQTAIIEYLQANPDAQTLFVLDAATGRTTAIPPVLWAAGCQGVGAPPALTADGRVLVFYRSAYGNWNHGVAPLVALGLLDLVENKITPLFHQQGVQPRWNAFWGTADESQNFLTAGHTLVIVHQGTLSAFDLQKNELFTLFGERDRYGGYRNPPWARNEWHGPGRSGVAVAANRLYWQTGSRIFCLSGATSASRELPKPRTISAAAVRAQSAPAIEPVAISAVRSQLVSAVQEIISTNWMPLFTDPGLSGRDFSFDESADLFEVLALSMPHVPAELQARARRFLEREWHDHSPFSAQRVLPLNDGLPREWFAVPGAYRTRLGNDKRPHRFGGVYAAWLFADRCGEQRLVDGAWPEIKSAFDEFTKSGWRLDPAKGDLFANRYLAGLLACEKLAARAGDADSAKRARAKAIETADALAVWWKRAGGGDTLRTFNTSAELDPFIGKGDGLSFAVAPHRHKLALFRDLTPEVADIVRERAPEAASNLWQVFNTLYQTWWIAGEERQVHFGENFVDPPDLALCGFEVMRWVRRESASALSRRIDRPFCRADLDYAKKLALTLASMSAPKG